MKGFFNYLVPATTVAGLGLLWLRINRCNEALRRDHLYWLDIKERADVGDNKKITSRVAAHLQEQREWLSLPFTQKLLCPPPKSWTHCYYEPKTDRDYC